MKLFVIQVNYDSSKKFRTFIGDIGSNGQTVIAGKGIEMSDVGAACEINVGFWKKFSASK